jgi:hypothetical protein
VSGADAPRILTKRRASSQPDLSFLARA